MRRRGTLARAGLMLGLFLSVVALSAPARAQDDYACPDGYYYDPDYGCVPNAYFTGPPYYYIYPDFGFGFFYGGGWPHARGFVGPPHGVFHGGPPAAGGVHGARPGAPHGGVHH